MSQRSSFRPVERVSGVPIHEQVYRALREALLGGDLAGGELLPSERRLADSFGVTRVTLRKALERLSGEGLLESAAGRGWLVTTAVVEPPSALRSFSALAASRNLEASSKVLDCIARGATLDEAELLGAVPGGEVLYLKRVRYLEGMPIALAESVLPLKFVPGLESVDFDSISLYTTLETRYGIVPTTAHYSLEARSAEPEWAEHLDLRPGQPVLLAYQKTLDQGGVPIEIGRIIYRGDRYRFEASLKRELQDQTATERTSQLRWAAE